jgi:DNA-binding NtrC family response regulator
MSAIAGSNASVATSILVIDDDKAVVFSVQAILEDAGFYTFTAGNGIAGVDAFKKHAPAIVLTDIIMPDQDGIATILQLRRLCPDVKIIAMSGGGRIGNTDFLSVAEKLGAVDTLPKPFSADDLLSMVGRLLNNESIPTTASVAA